MLRLHEQDTARICQTLQIIRLQNQVSNAWVAALVVLSSWPFWKCMYMQIICGEYNCVAATQQPA